MIMSRRLASLRIKAAVCLGLAFAFSGCAARKGLIVEPGKPPIVYEAKPVAVLQGKASYYFGRWIGRKTANGEIYRAADSHGGAQDPSLSYHGPGEQLAEWQVGHRAD
jgi:Lipoproteins